jgi:hypothetical protein
VCNNGYDNEEGLGMNDIIYLIRALDVDAETGEVTWWGNRDGWGDLRSATLFAPEERALNLPYGGEWVEFVSQS